MTTNTDYDLKQLTTTIDYGLMLDAIKAIIGFSLRNNKTETIKQLEAAISHFYSNLTSEQLTEFQADVSQIFKPKLDQFKKELQQTYSPEQTESILKKITQKSHILSSAEA